MTKVFKVTTQEAVSRAQSGTFYPVKKYIGYVFADDKLMHSTGRCSTRASAFNRAAAKMAELRNSEDSVGAGIDQLFANGGRMF